MLEHAGGGRVGQITRLSDHHECVDAAAVPAQIFEKTLGGGEGEVREELIVPAQSPLLNAGDGGEALAGGRVLVAGVRDGLDAARDSGADSGDPDIFEGGLHGDSEFAFDRPQQIGAGEALAHLFAGYLHAVFREDIRHQHDGSQRIPSGHIPQDAFQTEGFWWCRKCGLQKIQECGRINHSGGAYELCGRTENAALPC